MQLGQQCVEAQAPRGPGAAVQRLRGTLQQATALTAQPSLAELRCRFAQPFETSVQGDIRRRVFLEQLVGQRHRREVAGVFQGQQAGIVGVQGFDHRPANRIILAALLPLVALYHLVERLALGRVGPGVVRRCERLRPFLVFWCAALHAAIRTLRGPNGAWLRMVLPGPGGGLIKHELLLFCILQQRNRFLHHALPPEVARCRLHFKRRVTADAEREWESGVEREFRQRALAEAVDRGDVGAVEVADGVRQPGLGLRVCNAGAPPVPGQFARLIAGRGRGVAHGVARRVQGLPDAGAQFAGGSDREGDDQQALDAVAGFDHEARGQRGERIGLAGTGAGLDQQAAVQGRGERGRSCVVHDVASRNGPSRRLARSLNESSTGLSPKIM